MTQFKFKELSPAKINLFLKIINQRDDGYHNLRTGITLINLFDEVIAQQNDKFEINYIGKFAPKNKKFENCIIKRFFSEFNITKPAYKFTITKNIPIKSGLGSASSNLAAVLRILNKLGYNNLKKEYSKIGSDVPFFVNNTDSLVRGVGDKVIKKIFPKYYFLIVKPLADCSTAEMFNLININNIKYDQELDTDEIDENDYGNDFEFSVKQKFNEIKVLFNFFSDFPNVIFNRLTGSGSCIFAAFETKKDAQSSKLILRDKFPNLWSKVVENNFI